MVDNISIIYPKIKSFDELVSHDSPFPDSEPYEEEIFYDVRRKDRIKPNFDCVKTSIERIPELIPFIFREGSMKNV